MLGRTLNEEPLQLGPGGRLFGILSKPPNMDAAGKKRPVFVFLSAGLLHRVGPYRLHVQLARELAAAGFMSLRIDLSGKGDSPARDSMPNRESVKLDFDDICSVLRTRYGSPAIVLVGLCSGADNAVRLCQLDSNVVGLVLLDPICFPDNGFKRRELAAKYLNAGPYIRKLKQLFQDRQQSRRQKSDGPGNDPLTLRDLPTLEQMRRSFQLIEQRGGLVISIFTQYALRYYNAAGQLEHAMQTKNFREYCVERFWPDVEHTYKLEIHRERLLAEVLTWARNFA